MTKTDISEIISTNTNWLEKDNEIEEGVDSRIGADS